jgi:hypothetical protein
VGKAEERNKVAAREITTRLARLGTALYFSNGPLFEDGSPNILLIKSNSDMVFSSGLFPWVFTQISLCNVYGFSFYASANVWLIT